MKYIFFMLFFAGCAHKQKQQPIDSKSEITSPQEIKIHPIEYPDSDNTDWAYRKPSSISYNHGVMGAAVFKYSVPIIIHYSKKTDSFHLMWNAHSKIHIYVEKGCELIYDSLGRIIVRSTGPKNKTLHIERVETLNQY